MTKKNSKRIALLDEIRGVAIICMVVYHTLFFLVAFKVKIPFITVLIKLTAMNITLVAFEVKKPFITVLMNFITLLMNSTVMNITRDIFAGLFIFISGAMCRFSRNNLKRGTLCFFFGMVITFVVPFFANASIMFGILHFMGISMLIYGLAGAGFEEVPAWVGLLICALLTACTWNIRLGFFGIHGLFELHIPSVAYDVGILFPLGMYNCSFSSWDYFPLLPWFFVFLGGSYFGEWAKNDSLPKFFYPVHIRWLATVGRNTIWIYLLHVPIIFAIFAILNLIF